jgi:serine/threonine-protein kinase HipA
MKTEREILVYADWEGIKEPFLMGTLSGIPAKGKEVFSFQYTRDWLKSEFGHLLDPDLQFYSGRYFPGIEKSNFGLFMDSSPDRWGRVLMDRREAIMARKEKRSAKKLMESDYLLGVFDGHRMGGLRFKSSEEGKFLNDDLQMAAPPFTSLYALEEASKKFEEDNSDDEEYLKWINLLIAPGSSLGGARPKASVADPSGHLWIAKFPSIKDEKDIGGWEMVVNTLAGNAGLNVAKGDIRQFKNKQHTYLTKRFDRKGKNGRIHFASAMTLLGYVDGDGADSGVSYLEMAEFVIKHSADVNADLKELWTRIVFFICIKNTDDHLRNHGFLLTNQGWRLSPAYDINPNQYGTGLSLNISENDNSLDLELAMEVSSYFRLNTKQANQVIKKIETTVSSWRNIATNIGISKAEQDRMKKAFE